MRTALRGLVGDRLAAAFQVSPANPLVGVDGRLVLLRRLGEVLRGQPEVFGADVPRPGRLFDAMVKPFGVSPPPTATVAAHDILVAAVDVAVAHLAFAQNSLADLSSSVPLGDCWRHSAVRGPGLTDGLDAVSQAVAMADLFTARAL
jgi:hypothetical protein